MRLPIPCTLLAVVALAFNAGSAQTVSRQLAITPTSVNFGSVSVGSSTNVSLTITNTGNKSTTLKPPRITGTGFSCNGLPASLGPGQSSAFTVTFTPASVGIVSGSLSVGGTGSNQPATVALSGMGSGYPQLATSPISLSFGTVTVGTSSTLPVTITNTGAASATISQYGATGSGFSVSGLMLPLSLAPGQSTSFSVTFTPSTAGTASGTASVVSNASNSPTNVALDGSSISAVGQLATNPTTLSFGTVTVGTSSTLPVVLTNTGTGGTTISQATISGSGFSVSGLALPLTLAPGEGTSFNVAFAPTTAGSVSGSVSLASDASNSPTSVSLSATGGNQHYVSLSWTDTSTVAGYNIYRATQSGGPYTQINSSLDPNMSYTDDTVLAGQTYYYVTTAVSSTGIESTYSAEVAAVIPSP